MPVTSPKSRATRYGLIIFLIITLFLCATFFYLRDAKGSQLSNDIEQLAQLREDYSQIDTCIVILYNADNSSRLYAATGDRKYIRDFFVKINHASIVLDKLNTSTSFNSPENLKGLVEQKKLRTSLYLKLRHLTDSLIVNSMGIDTSKGRSNLDVAKEITYKQFKTMVSIDTINKAQIIKNKSFLRRVGDLFKRSDKSKAADTSVKLIRSETKLDTSLQSKNFNDLPLKNMNNYFRNLYAANSLLKKNEVEILNINKRIIKELVALLQEFKEKEKEFITQSRALIKSNVQGTYRKIDEIFLLSIGLLSLLVITIMYNLWKIYRNENNLINYSQQASQYAISKSRFLANMSHEIRTPLNSVIGFSEQLGQGNLTGQQVEQVNAIRNSSVMLLDVVNDILDFSKYETGKISFDKINFIPFDSINEVFNSITIQASKKSIAFKNEISFKNNICFSGDSLRLKQVVMNLLSNAIKFTDKGGVTLKAGVVNLSKNNALLKIQIIDTGIGIAAEDVDMIFDEFAQVYYSSAKIKQKGTGLGLAICKKIVEFQGGQIGVTSELGKGSIFSFEIPYETCSMDSVLENKNIMKIDGESLEGKKVLLADDNKLNILLAQTVLKKYKLVIDVAYNGKQAFELFKNNTYDLILTDIQMPEMGGVELTRTIRAYSDQTKINVPILGVTANVLQEDRKKYIESGINDLVLKPFSEKELVDKISEYLNA
jgi:signal transduction histidine kinase